MNETLKQIREDIATQEAIVEKAHEVLGDKYNPLWEHLETVESEKERLDIISYMFPNEEHEEYRGESQDQSSYFATMARIHFCPNYEWSMTDRKYHLKEAK